MRITFLHPCLGAGGAERMVVEAASQLSSAGHEVRILCAERLDHGLARELPARVRVDVSGSWLPRHVGQRLRAPCTVARMCWLAARALLSGPLPEVVVVDVVPHPLPILRALGRSRLVYYCHFPDRLTTPPREGLYRLYRIPLDRSESMAIGHADLVLVNSRFTREKALETFPGIGPDRVEVLHPGIDAGRFAHVPPVAFPDGPLTLLALGRFHAHKNHELAVRALALLGGELPRARFDRVQLVIAGSFDEGLSDAARTEKSILDLSTELGVRNRIRLHRNPAGHEIAGLLGSAAARPVLAVDAGGPRETVEDGTTGFLRPPDPAAFASALRRLLLDEASTRAMGLAGRERVRALFTRELFGRRLEAGLTDLLRRRPRP